MAAASSSTSFLGARSEEEQQQNVSTTSQSAASQQKKKRSLPGTPNPDAEVIALSPKTLMATNRFICEVCNKGFQREQNLQLHRRGHNLPWKLKQKSNKIVKRKVYLCPEPSCVHHDPSRALGDLTGIKKHFSRKHGEKKYKCDKCSKKYAVQSDWKAHSKTCGTREYRCDCGTLFSRRDSFITHRAFCDALAQESARHPAALGSIGSHLFGNHLSNSINLGLSQVGSQISQLHDSNHQSSATNILSLGNVNLEQAMLQQHQTPLLFHQQQQMPSNSSSSYFLSDSNHGLNQVFDYEQQSQSQQHGLMSPKPNIHGLMHLPDFHSNSKTSPNLFNLGFFSSGGSNPTNGLKNSENDSQNNDTNISSSGFMIPHHQFNNNINPHHESQMPPHMSATALLQKAAQMGSTTSNNNNNTNTMLNGLGTSSTTSVGGDARSHTTSLDFRGNSRALQSEIESENQLQGLMNSLNSDGGGGNSTMYGSLYHAGNRNQNLNFGNMMSESTGKLDHQSFSSSSVGNSNRTTLDFLGVGYSQQQDPTLIQTSTQGNHVQGGGSSNNLQGN